MKNKQLQAMLHKRVKLIEIFADHIWENRKEILKKQEEAQIKEECSFNDAPEDYISPKFLKTVSSDLIYSLHDYFNDCVLHANDMTMTGLLNVLLGDGFILLGDSFIV